MTRPSELGLGVAGWGGGSQGMAGADLRESERVKIPVISFILTVV